jgi:hypothetical protein
VAEKRSGGDLCLAMTRQASARRRDTSGRGSEDGPRIIEETRQYIRDFDHLVETTGTARELYDEMLKRHPLRMNVNALWTSALAAER